MADDARILFIPVSGPSGMGEVARCVTIAGALRVARPATQMLFALSAAAPYLADVPFPQRLFPSSPTFHPAAVAALIAEWRPTTVVFDNAGRTAQLRAARAAGARIIYVSSRRRQRRKAFRLHWMRLIDEHWIAYPKFIAGPPTLGERLRLRILGRPVVRYLDALFPPADPDRAAAVRARHQLADGGYVLVVPGGGTVHRGATHSPVTVAGVAAALAASGRPTLLVGAAPPPAAPPGLRSCGRLPVAELCDLIRGASMVLVNGGDTLLQVLACGRPCLAVPMAKDQAHRIDCCVREGLVVAGSDDVGELAQQALALAADASTRDALTTRLGASGLDNALDTVVSRLLAAD